MNSFVKREGTPTIRAPKKKKDNVSSPPTTLEIRGVNVHFPFQPYACQKAYMEKVMDALFKSEHALLESPTGTGKTLCLLCSTLAWQREQSRLLAESAANLLPTQQSQPQVGHDAVKSRRVPTIIYASRTHSQLTQVVNELKNTRYRPQHAVLGSREQMCVHPKVKTAHASGFDINNDCNKLGKERKCRFRNKLEGFRLPQDDGHTQTIMDMEDLVEMGKAHKVCPFYYTRSQVERAELVLVPYNYLFDRDARSHTLGEIPWDNSVVIFDEAHNLESFASESASFDLSNADISGCVSEVQKAINYVKAMPDSSHNVKLENLQKLKALFLGVEEFLVDKVGERSAFSGEYMMEFFRLSAGINHANHEIMIEELRKVSDLLVDMRGTGASRGLPRLEHFVQCLKRVFGFTHESKCIAKAASYRVHVSQKDDSGGRTISYWCFAPALAMEELAGLGVRSILVTSGTLSPLPSYGLELGIPFPHKLENPHIIRNDQIHVRIIGRGVSGRELTSSYQRRQDADYYTELGSTLASLAKVTPAGMLVFFPSYGVMEASLEKWGGPTLSRKSFQKDKKKNFFAVRKKQASSRQFVFPQTPSCFASKSGTNTPWSRLCSIKSVVLEPRSSADLPEAMSEFKRLLSLPRSPGCILMGVCRGKISEGIDFTHEMSRAVVITGLPFAPAFDAKVKMKREFLDNARASNRRKSTDGGFGASHVPKDAMKLSGDDWYTQQAHRAVNQAIGRVIRNRSDYGAVLLLDSRFSHQRNQFGLSKWVRPHILKDEGFGAAIKSLGQFYRNSGAKDKERIAKEREQEQRNATTLAYESDDDDHENVTKVAYIRTEAAGRDNAKGSLYIGPDQVVGRADLNVASNRVNDSIPSKAPIKAQKQSNQGFDSVFKAQTQPTNSKAVAAAFMASLKKNLTPAEQSAVRKAIVAIKAAGNRRDRVGYLKQVDNVLSYICSRKHFEDCSCEPNERMVFQLLRLLPSTYIGNVRKAVMTKIVQESVMQARCKEALSALNLSRLQSMVSALLEALWKDDCHVSTEDFTSQAGPILRLIYTASNELAVSAVKSFLKLLPNSFRTHAYAMNDEIIGKKRAGKLQKSEKIRASNPLVDSARFVTGYARTVQLQQKSTEANAEVKTNAPTKPESAQHQPQKRSEPSSSVPQQPLRTINPYARKKSLKLPPSNAKPTPKMSSTSIALKAIESEPFQATTVTQIRDKIKSNAPANLQCPICMKACSEPFMAPCGHLACLSCWVGWLQRSSNCHTCRVATTKESLSKAVFTNKPTLSLTKDSHDSDELEIC